MGGGDLTPRLATSDWRLDVAQLLSEYDERIASRLSKDDLIDMQGTVVAVHSGGLYRVQCDAGHEVLAQLSGRMRRFRIKVVPGDRVTVGVSPYDPVRGIITFRAR
jgi:translation initiation factor IF-1